MAGLCELACPFLVQGASGGEEKLLIVRRFRTLVRTNAYNEIIARWKLVLRLAKRFTQPALRLISNDCIADAPGDGKPESRMGESVGFGVHEKGAGVLPHVRFVDGAKLGTPSDAHLAAEAQSLLVIRALCHDSTPTSG